MVSNMSLESIKEAMRRANEAKEFIPLKKKRALSKTLKKPIKEKLKKKKLKKKGGK